ncbi:uncharacterized protein LOC131625878 [Vicia villosa]|uniref:uncharacterized protein LOC131625878 n=1 Tax=Vicia villosa TaxID=3911 RepID=UPI00273C4C09|nr:uncharacterized protein LOC131625878 [Vicia villosa]
MIILSYNLRGGGIRAKRKRVGFLIQKGDVDLCFIQETKLSGIGMNLVKEMWGGVDVEWSFLDAIGASGGILTVWKKDFFGLNYSFICEGFLGLCVEKEGKLVYFVNVYTSCDKPTRRRTWKKLCEFKNNNTEGYWCIGGDFNSTSSLDERIGVPNSGYSMDLRFFNEFIEEMGLVDLPTIGGFSKEEVCTRPEPHGINLNVLPLGDSLDLEKPFSEEEIKDAIWSCDGNKSLGPDGFSLEFFKRFWFLLKDDLMKLCNDFYLKGTLVNAITSSFLALIPKKKNPQDLSEYRPICLVGSIYKILAKILAARMRGVLDKLISITQTAFVPGRSMMDVVLMVNEILDWEKRKKRGCLLLKVDFEKAYDSISWNYLRWIMGRMGFGKRWMN